MACYEPCGEDPDEACGDLEEATRDFVDGCVQAIDTGANDGADGRADQLTPELGFGTRAQEMATFEVLQEVACLEGTGFTNPSSNEIDGDSVGTVGGHDSRKDELCQFGDARDGVEVCLSEGADAHDAEEHGKEKGEYREAEIDDSGKGVLDGEDAEDEGEDEADEGSFETYLVFGWCIVVGLVVEVLGFGLLEGVVGRRALWLVEIDGAVATHDWSSNVLEVSPQPLLSYFLNGIWSVLTNEMDRRAQD